MQHPGAMIITSPEPLAAALSQRPAAENRRVRYVPDWDDLGKSGPCTLPCLSAPEDSWKQFQVPCGESKGKGKVLGRSPNSSVTVIPTCPSQRPFRLAGSQTP